MQLIKNQINKFGYTNEGDCNVINGGLIYSRKESSSEVSIYSLKKINEKIIML